MLMDPDVWRVDEDVFEIGIIRQSLENPLPDALLRPTPKAGVDGEPLAEFPRQITPGRAGARNPQHRFDKHSIVTRGGAGPEFRREVQRLSALNLLDFPFPGAAFAFPKSSGRRRGRKENLASP